MTIYILDQDPEETAKFLDNKSLKFMIKDIAQLLCNVHHDLNQLSGKYETHHHLVPLSGLDKKHYYKWSQWARECVANYEYLWKLGFACDWELAHRNDFKLSKKYHDILEWCRDNVPDLPQKPCEGTAHIFGECKCCKSYDGKPTPLPLVMPKKYSEYYKGWEPPRTIAAYRNYYQAKLARVLEKCDIGHQKDNDQTGCPKVKWTSREIPEWLNL